MSHEQKMLRLRVDNKQDAEISNALKQTRNLLQHAIRRKAQENATTKLDPNIEEIERLHDGAKIFKSVRLLYPTPCGQHTLHDDHAGKNNSGPSSTGKLGRFLVEPEHLEQQAETFRIC